MSWVDRLRCERRRRIPRSVIRNRGLRGTDQRVLEENRWVRTVRGQSDITASDNRFLAQEG